MLALLLQKMKSYIFKNELACGKPTLVRNFFLCFENMLLETRNYIMLLIVARFVKAAECILKLSNFSL